MQAPGAEAGRPDVAGDYADSNRRLQAPGVLADRGLRAGRRRPGPRSVNTPGALRGPRQISVISRVQHPAVRPRALHPCAASAPALRLRSQHSASASGLRIRAPGICLRPHSPRSASASELRIHAPISESAHLLWSRLSVTGSSISHPTGGVTPVRVSSASDEMEKAVTRGGSGGASPFRWGSGLERGIHLTGLTPAV